MASFSGFLRKSPSARLESYFKSWKVEVPSDFDWQSEGRGNALVKDINALIDDLPALQQDRIKAQLDHLASLSNPNGMLSAEQVCRAEGIDLEGLEGVEDVVLMLAIDHPIILERVSVQASLLQRYGGKNWSTFQYEDDGKPWALGDDLARKAFEEEAIKILDLPKHRRHEGDWFTTLRAHPITGEETEVVQATIYVEDRAACELAFGTAERLERRVVQKVLEVGIAINAADRVLEICAKGGKKVRDKYAEAFSKHFAPNSAAPVEAPRREVLLDRLKQDLDFEVEPADAIDRVEVSALEFWSSSGGFARFELRGKDETIYSFLDRQFRDASPLTSGGWMITAATLRVMLDSTDGKRKKTLTVTLKSPNSTTIPNKTEAERQFAMRLLERWQLIAPPPEPLDLLERD